LRFLLSENLLPICNILLNCRSAVNNSSHQKYICGIETKVIVHGEFDTKLNITVR
jgi:hypothetical protein